MSKQTIWAAAATMLLVSGGSWSASAWAGSPFGPGPAGAPSPNPPTGRGFAPGGPDLGDVPAFSDNKPVQSGGGKDPAAEPSPTPPTHQEILDRLFARLAKASDPDEAAGIAGVIERLWMQSGSDTADLLMARAMEAAQASHRDIALSLLDKVVGLDPGWAEAWNKRATLRFLDDDDSGAMEDIGHTLALEPRHFGALSGMGFILKRNGLEKGALTALRRAQSIYPESPDIKKAVDDLVPDVEGRDL